VFKTFPKGGIHPPENKLTDDRPVVVLPLPHTVTVTISQHIGAPAVPVVAKGDMVRTGQVIAAAKGFVSANVHSPVSGTVARVEPVVDTTGYRQTAIVIEASGDEWADGIDLSTTLDKDIRLSREEIVARCLECGIVGMGGATFPTHVKMGIPSGKRCDLLIINGVECEPFLTSDHRLMLEKGEEVLTGVSALMKALNVNKAVIGIEINKPDAIENLTTMATGFEGITIQPLKVKYPQGGEKQLIKAICGREVPSGKLPLDVNVVVQNVATAYAVYEAVQKNKPLVERIVTVTGDGLSNPGNFKVRIGTPVSALIEAAGGMPGDTGKVINGGPMMGKALADINAPVTKGTSGVVLFHDKTSRRAEVTPCIRCTKCTYVCPMGLEPWMLAASAERGMYDRVEKGKVTDCIECGSCAYTCPAKRPLLDYIRLGKSTVMRMIRERNTK